MIIKKILIFLIFLSLVFTLILAGYLYFESKEDKLVNQDENSNSKEDLINCGKANTIVQNSNNPGIILLEADKNTMSAWSCFGEALKKCEMAKIEAQVEDEDYDFYSIGAKSDNGCPVYFVDSSLENNANEGKFCYFDDKTIEFLFSNAEKNFPEDEFFKGYSVTGIISSGEFSTVLEDSTEIDVECLTG